MLSKLWNAEDFERGMFYASIVAIVYFIINAQPDYDLFVEHAFNVAVPYGVLWSLLNPFYWTSTLYTSFVVIEWVMVTLVEWTLAESGRIPLKMVKLQIFTVAALLALHSTQNVTVIMFAPLVVINPLFSILLIAQKIPFGWSLIPWQNAHWDCAFNGTGTVADLATNPCLSNSLKLAFWTHIYFLNYFILALWTILPLIVWWRNRQRFKPISAEKKTLVVAVLVDMLRSAQEEEIAENLGDFWNNIES